MLITYTEHSANQRKKHNPEATLLYFLTTSRTTHSWLSSLYPYSIVNFLCNDLFLTLQAVGYPALLASLRQVKFFFYVPIQFSNIHGEWSSTSLAFTKDNFGVHMQSAGVRFRHLANMN
jgi:hypothetical protein